MFFVNMFLFYHLPSLMTIGFGYGMPESWKSSSNISEFYPSNFINELFKVTWKENGLPEEAYLCFEYKQTLSLD